MPNIQQLSSAYKELVTAMLYYSYNLAWQTVDDVNRIATLTNNLSEVYKDMNYAEVSQIDFGFIYNRVAMSFKIHHPDSDHPLIQPQDWDLFNLMNKNFVRSFLHSNAYTVEVKSYLNKRY